MPDLTLPLPVAADASPPEAGPAREIVWLRRVFVLTLTANGLAAYSVGPVPVEWLGMVLAIGCVTVLGLFRTLYVVPGTRALLLLIFWAVVVTAVNAVGRDYSTMIPRLATTSYAVYVLLRFLVLFSFTAFVYITYWLLRHGQLRSVLRSTVGLGTFMAAAALYMYVAQLTGLPEPPRTRLGTGGGEQAIQFTYAFHRALGTFREPSHLAEWLIVPLFLSLALSGSKARVQRVTMAAALLLTGSLTGIMGAAAGITGALLLSNPLRGRSLRWLLELSLVSLAGILLFRLIARGTFTDAANIFAVIGDRLAPVLLEGGLSASNRGYIYEYLQQQSLPLLGFGAGHANLRLSHMLQSDMIVSFLNLYAMILMSVGVVGLALALWMLFVPLLRFTRRRLLARSRLGMAVAAAYISWLVMYFVHAEEFRLMFAVVFALLAYITIDRPWQPDESTQ